MEAVHDPGRRHRPVRSVVAFNPGKSEAWAILGMRVAGPRNPDAPARDHRFAATSSRGASRIRTGTPRVVDSAAANTISRLRRPSSSAVRVRAAADGIAEVKPLGTV